MSGPGDIDLPGPHFINDLRAHGINARTILTDTHTLRRYQHLAVSGASTIRSTVPHLTATEHILYQHLADHATSNDTGLLLEQERIPWAAAEQALTDAILNDGHDTLS